MCKTLFEAPELTEYECTTVFATHIGQIDLIDGWLRFTLCEQRKSMLIPVIRIARSLEAVRRDAPLVKACVAGEHYLWPGGNLLAARH